MINTNIHIEYVLDTNTTLYQAYKDSTRIYKHFQESYERLTKANSYHEWVASINDNLDSPEGEELLNAINRLAILNGKYPKPIQKLDRTFPDGSIGTGDFFKKPENVYIFKFTENIVLPVLNIIESPKPIIITDTIILPEPFNIKDIISISKNYGKLWKSSVSGYIPPANEGGYYYLVILNNNRRLILTIDEYKQLIKI